MSTDVREAALNLAAAYVGNGDADLVVSVARKFEAYLSGNDEKTDVPRMPSMVEVGGPLPKGQGRKSGEKCLLDRIDAVIALGHEPSYSMKREALEWLAKYELRRLEQKET